MRAEPFTPWLLELKAPHNAIAGFGFFARWSRLPDWLAWETFAIGKGCPSLAAMQQRIQAIRARIDFRGSRPAIEIGCVLLVQPVFFTPDEWVRQPANWPVR